MHSLLRETGSGLETHLPQPALSGHLDMSLDDPREEIQDGDVSIGHDDLVILQRHNQVTSSD